MIMIINVEDISDMHHAYIPLHGERNNYYENW